MSNRSGGGALGRWIARGAIWGAVIALVAFPVAWVLDAQAVEIQKIRPLDTAAVTANKLLFEPGDDVTEVYGARLGEPVRVLFIDETRILRPKEDPSLVLYPTGDEFVLQTRWVFYSAKMVALGAGTAALLLAAWAWWVRRRRATGESIEPAAAV